MDTFRKVIAFSLLAALLVSVGGGRVSARDALADKQEYTRTRKSIYNSIEEIRARLEARQEGEQPASEEPVPTPVTAPKPAPAPVPVPKTAAPEAPAKPAPKKGSILDRIKGIWSRSKGEKAPAAPAAVPKAAPAPPVVVTPKVAPPPPVVSAEPKVLVKRIAFSGNSVFDGDYLNRLLAPELRRKLTLPQLKAMAQRVAVHYHDHGYFLARVVIPQQSIAKGTVRLVVLEGRLEDFVVRGNDRYLEKNIRRAFSALETGEAIRKQTLERALLVLNSTSGIEAKSVLQAGGKTGATDLILHVAEYNATESSLSVNNFGSRTSGRYRISPRFEFPNVSRRGDSVGVSAVAAPDTDTMLFGHFNYTTPVGSRGHQLKAFVSGGRYEVGKEFAVLDIKGDSISYGLGMTYPLLLTRQKSVTYEAWYEFNESEHSLLGTITSFDQISKLRLGLTWDRKDDRGRNIFSFDVHQGLGDSLGGMEDDSTLSSRSFALADNRFTKFEFDLTRVHTTSPRVFHIARCSGQASVDPLVSGEQWAIGGANSVRGHLQSTYLGDDGYTINWETRISMPSGNKNRYQLVVFADHGMAYIKIPTTGQEETQRISGAGLGVRADFPHDINLRFDLGFPLGPNTGKDYVPYIQLMKSFE